MENKYNEFKKNLHNTSRNIRAGKRLKAFIKALKIKFEIAKEQPYGPAFVSKIQKSREQVKEGKTVKMNLDEIWKE